MALNLQESFSSLGRTHQVERHIKSIKSMAALGLLMLWAAKPILRQKLLTSKPAVFFWLRATQKCLHEAVNDYFETGIAVNNLVLCQLQAHEETHSGHGRIETRRCYLLCLDTPSDMARWKGLADSAGLTASAASTAK